MDFIIRTNNRSKDLQQIKINNVVSATTYSYMSELVSVDDLENLNLNNVIGTLNLVGDTNLSISKDTISSIEIIK